MNILFILPEYYPHSGGGISTYYLHYIRALRPYCNRLKVLVGSGFAQGGEALLLDGVEVEYLERDIYQKYLALFSKFDPFPDLKRNLAAAWAMMQQAGNGENFDIVECTDFALGFVPWVITRYKPVITRLHGSSGQITSHEGDLSKTLQNDFVRQTELLLLPLCDLLISHSRANKIAWENLLQKEVSFSPPAFDPDPAPPLPAAKRRPFGVVTGRIQIWKGPIVLCKAMSVAGKNLLPVEWYGRDFSYKDGISMSRYLKENFPAIWGKTVIPKPAVTLEQAHRLQKDARFGLICSTWDMFNFTVAEFLAAGTPVICSEGAGASELVRHGVNGLKCSPDDIAGLANCIGILSTMDERTYENMAKAAIETITNDLSPSAIIARNLEYYHSVAGKSENMSANDFLRHIYEPSERQIPVAEILDTQPLEKLFKYIVKRAISRARK